MKHASPDAGTRIGRTDINKLGKTENPFCLELAVGLDPSWQQPKVFLLKGTALRVGRLRAPPTGADGDVAPNDIVLPAESVSRRHAVLQLRGDMWWVSDRGSAGGTSLNDVRLDTNTPELPIAVGDRLQLGPRVTLVCRGESEGRTLLASELPTPLARLESALKTHPEPVKRATTLFLELDRALRFLVACALASLRRLAVTDEALRERLAHLFKRDEFAVASAGRPLSTGTWMALYSALAKLFPRDAPGTFAKLAGPVADEMGEVKGLVKLRNLWAHSNVPSERELAEAEPDLERMVTVLLRAFATFPSLRLMSVARTENLVEGCRYGVYLLKGNESARHQKLDSTARMLHRWCYLVDLLDDPDCENPLLLAPLLAADELRGGAKILFASRLDLGPKTAKVALSAPDTGEPPVTLELPWSHDIAALYEACMSARPR